MMKSIRLSGHARENMHYRGATEQEVVEVIQTVPWGPVELGRLECRKILPMDRSGTADSTPQNRFGLSSWRRLMKLWWLPFMCTIFDLGG